MAWTVARQFFKLNLKSVYTRLKDEKNLLTLEFWLQAVSIIKEKNYADTKFQSLALRGKKHKHYTDRKIMQFIRITNSLLRE